MVSSAIGRAFLQSNQGLPAPSKDFFFLQP
jgi:hypothetical protein